jgi:hypothetical protein
LEGGKLSGPVAHRGSGKEGLTLPYPTPYETLTRKVCPPPKVRGGDLKFFPLKYLPKYMSLEDFLSLGARVPPGAEGGYASQRLGGSGMDLQSN